MKKTSILLLNICMLPLLFSCQEALTDQEESTPLVSVKTTTIIQGDIERNINLSGKIIYLKKNAIIAPITGYIAKMNLKYSDRVQKNDVLFEIETKEKRALASSSESVSKIENIKVLASSGGIINELNISETGGYVVEGDILCHIVADNDLMIQVNVPFEFNNLMKTKVKCQIFLADNSGFSGSIYKILPVIDEINQTQAVLIKPDTYRQLPENLNLTVQFLKDKHSNVLLTKKESVMADETLSEFWVIKIVDNNMAVIVPITKGLENDSLVEILSSELKLNDLVISEGAFGLPDSTIIRIVK